MPRNIAFAEPPLVPKLREGLLAKIKEKFPLVAAIDAADYADLELMEQVRQQHEEVDEYINSILTKKQNLTSAVKKHVRDTTMDEIFGFGPLNLLLRRPDVANIYVEGSERVFFERYDGRGRRSIEKVRLHFRDDEHVMDIIYRLLTPLGLTMDETNPLVTGKLPNGSVIYASMPPASVHGPSITLLCNEYEAVNTISGWALCHNKVGAVPQVQGQGDQDSPILSMHIPVEGMHTHLTQVLSARSFRGRTVRFSAAVKGAGSSTANLSINAWGGKRMQPTCVWGEDCFPEERKKKDGWLRLGSTVAVPQSATILRMHIGFDDPGDYQIKDLTFEVLGDDGAPMPLHHRMKRPVNLALRV